MRNDSKVRINLATIVGSVLLALLMPFMFVDLMTASFAKLHLSPQAALILLGAMLIGGFINIPIYRAPGATPVVDDPQAVFGLAGFWPALSHTCETTIAVNVGGCVVPTGLAAYEVFRLAEIDSRAIAAVMLASVIDVVVCFLAARPVPDLGIVMSAFWPALTAAVSAFVFYPAQAPPIAFVAGVVGTIVGADLLHLKTFVRTTPGMASIGGAGTFDGIILTSILAAYLA